MSHLRVRHVAEVNPTCPAWDRVPDEAELTFVPLEAVWPRRVDVSRVRSKAETASGYTRFQQGDVLVPKITPTFEADRSTWIEHIPTIVATGTTELHIVRARPGVEPRYLDHLFSSTPFLRGGEAEMIGVAGQKRVPDSWLRDFSVPITDPAGQRAIADYLDAETARIDALIAKKQRLIHLLEERAHALAIEMVTGSSDGEVTGIPTIPVAPRDWRVLRNKVFMREVAHLSETGEEEMLSVSHLTGVSPRSEKTVYMFEAESTVGHKLVEPGDLVINTMWAWMGAAGVSLVHGIVSPAYGVYRIDPTVVHPAWVDLLIRTEPYIVEMTRFSRGVTSSRLRLYPDDFLRLSSPVPPLTEQRRLVDRYREFRDTAGVTAKALTRQLDLLGEHRQALITAAVTGEFVVPGAA